MIIRDAVKEDSREMLRIQKAAFMRYTDALRPEQIPPLNETMEDLEKDFGNRGILVAVEGGGLAGSVRHSIKGGVCIIERLSVLPELQGKGIGRALVLGAESRSKGRAHKFYLETGLLASNLIAFYTRLGYSAEAVFRRHYGGFDWIAFSKFAGGVNDEKG